MPRSTLPIQSLLALSLLLGCSVEEQSMGQPSGGEMTSRYKSEDAETAMSDTRECEPSEQWPPYMRGTPLIEAIACLDFEAIDQLIKEEADLNEHNAVGTTPLKLAIRGSQHDIVVTLLDNGADINESGPESTSTPVMGALTQGTHTGDWRNFDELIVRGADVFRRPRRGGSNLLEKAVTLGRFCTIKPIFDTLSTAQLDEFRKSRRFTPFLIEGKGRNAEEEACRQEIVKLFD